MFTFTPVLVGREIAQGSASPLTHAMGHLDHMTRVVGISTDTVMRPTNELTLSVPQLEAHLPCIGEDELLGDVVGESHVYITVLYRPAADP